MKSGLVRKGLVLGIILLFFGAGVIPSTVGIKKEKTTSAVLDSPSYIQDLIDNALDGDTINIPSGTYYENIVINKSISLIGEDKETTIIYGNGSGDVIYISADWVNVSKFTIQNSGDEFMNAGICINSNYNTVSGNIFSNNYKNGISMDISINNINCSYNNNIIDNTITSNNGYGIYLHSADDNIIKGNIISNNGGGICLLGSDSNVITGNKITSNYGTGISLDFAYCNTILKNNLIDNGRDAFFSYRYNTGFRDILLKRNRWKQNFWNRSQLLPKFILGVFPGLNVPGGPSTPSWPWVNFDWRPALRPYDIS